MSDEDNAATQPEATPLAPPNGLSFATNIKKVAASNNFIRSMAIIGKDKSGKTRLGASASVIEPLVKAGKRTLIMEGEGGYSGIGDIYPDTDVMEFTNVLGFMRAIDELLTKEHNYGVVVIDTFDRFQDWYTKMQLAGAGTDTFGAYRAVRNWTLDTAWRLHKAPFTVIFLFHADEVKDANSGITSTTYLLQGSAGKELGQVFDIISFLTVENDENGNAQRVLQLGPKVGFPTGNRWEDKLPNKMVNATMNEIVSLVRSTPTEQK